MRARSSPIHAGRTNSSGFTLIELMVTLLVFAVVAVTLTVVLMNSARSKQGSTQRIETQQTARAALDEMSRDIRSAGYGADRDFATPQPAIAYVDSEEIILSENQSPYPEPLAAGPSAPLAYNPTGNPKPFPLNGTSWAPPTRYRTGAELVRYTLDTNNDGVVNASDLASPEGADAAATPNPNDYVLVRQVYGDSTGNVAGNNGGTTERVALVRKPGDPGVPPLFNVYMRGLPTPWDWSSGPVPQNQLQNIQRIELQVTATSSRPDSRGKYAQTVLKSEVNAARSVPDFGAVTYSVSGYVFNDLNTNHVKDGSDVGLAGATLRMGNLIAYSNNTGFFQFQAPAGQYTLKQSPPMGYGSFTVPDSFNFTLTTSAITRSFADTARSGGNVTIQAYNDENSNQVKDATESVLQGIRFTINPGSPSGTTTVTDAFGNATLFTSTGGFNVTCNSPDSLVVTTPNPQWGTMTNHGTASLAFGLNGGPTGHVAGKVFIDANKNGTLDAGESGLANVWVGVTKDAGLTVAGYAYTDASGNYNISVPINDPPHATAYSVYMQPPSGYFPTMTTSIGNLWVTLGSTLSNKNFGLASFQVITLTASRVLSLTSADLIENDWNGSHTENAHKDVDLILGADAGATDNVSAWFNQYPSTPLFNPTPSGSFGYTRNAPNSVLAMVVDTLDKNDVKARPDLVTGTRFTAAGNFFVWFTQGSNNNEGYLPSNYSTGQNYRTQDNGDVQAVATIDCGGGAMPDIIVGTKGATAGTGSIEFWLNNDATTPTFTRDETFTTIGGSTMGEVTGIVLADMDGDGDRDMVVTTRTSDYNGQIAVYENRGRTAGSRFVLRTSMTLSGDTPTAVACLDGDGDGYNDIFVGTQSSTSQGHVIQFKNLGAVTPYTFSNVRQRNAPGFVLSLQAADLGGSSGRGDLALGYRTSTAGYGGGVVIYYMDLGLLPSSTVDPSGGSLVNMVPAQTAANFNYGLNTTAPPPSLTDLAVAVKSSATGGALVIFVR